MIQPAGADAVTPPAIPAEQDPDAGTSRVGVALAQLAGLQDMPLSAHPEVYQGIHAELQGALAEIDNA